MSKHKPTPGPWAVNEDRWMVESEHEHGWVNDGWIICKADGPDREANARLIAAAPDLLEALERVASLMEFEDSGHPAFEGLDAQISAAIAKATGAA